MPLSILKLEYSLIQHFSKHLDESGQTDLNVLKNGWMEPNKVYILLALHFGKVRKFARMAILSEKETVLHEIQQKFDGSSNIH